MRNIALMILLFTVPSFAHSAVIEVPKDYTTIQAAIDSATTLDTVLVSPGTYVENIDFKGKTITVTSSGGSGVTVIDGNQSGSVVSFISGEAPAARLEGFTITNGNGVIHSTPYNTFQYGGGIYCENYSSPTIVNNIISGNSVDFDGGGICCIDHSSPTIMDSIISGNSAEFRGGGIYCHLSNPIIYNCDISENSTPIYAEGAGIFCNTASPTIQNCTISKNSAIGQGGGITLYHSSSPLIINNMIRENVAHSGAGIHCYLFSSPVIKQNIITENLAIPGGHYGWGAGIYIHNGSTPSIISNIISKNVVKANCIARGGGIFVEDQSRLIIANNIIWRNKLVGTNEGYGAGICCWGPSSLKMVNNTIVENSVKCAQGFGGGIFCTFWSNLNIINSIIRGNKTTVDGQELWVGGYMLYPSIVTITHSCMDLSPSMAHVEPGGGLYVNTGMINTDPLFVDSAYGDLHLTYLSPCKDAGLNSAVVKLTDFENDPRIAYSNVDIGADEFHTHIYYTGNARPGGHVALKLIDTPTTTPIIFWVGSGVLDTPFKSKKFGDWYLRSPLFLGVSLGAIPSPFGVLSLPYTFGPNIPLVDIPMQALIGKKLTNLCVMEVK